MNNNYFTRDYYLCAYLVASGLPILEFTNSAGITTFNFNETDELIRLVKEYYADHSVISPIRYGNALKNLKSLIRSNTNTYGNQQHHSQPRKNN